MELQFDSSAAYGLSRYVRLVSLELGLAGVGSYIRWDPPANAYLALDDRLPLFPGCDVALIWHEEHGWALGIETDSAEDLIILSYLGDDVLPAPRAVAEFARGVVSGRRMGRPQPPAPRRTNDDEDLFARLSDYAATDTATL